MFRLKLEATAFTEELVMGINFIKECLEISDIIMLFFTFFVYRPSLYNLFQMKPTRCTLLLSIFISTSLHVSGNCVPVIRRTCCIYAKLVFFTVYGCLSGLFVGMGLQSGSCLIC